eukprot:TRINITY_DN2025_c0_g2_i1.p1 TRINITY_DN2025_c0_g2~~TRINITY_DN2025_c0_g2_i1.p1  ORF type:complete len:400 (-),score=43.28 TRINITY_DN2025_c0_g2_i1:45-1166(-)
MSNKFLKFCVYFVVFGSNGFVEGQGVNCDDPNTPPWAIDCQQNLLPAERWIYVSESKFVDVNGLKMHYVDFGGCEQDKVYIFLHGVATWGYVWRNVAKYVGGCSNVNYPMFDDACVEEMQPIGRAIILDHVGFGLSDKPDYTIGPDGKPKFDYLIPSHTDQLAGFIDALGLGVQNGGQKLILVTNNIGGTIGVGYLGRFPDNVEGFVCVECYLGFSFPVQVLQTGTPGIIDFYYILSNFRTPLAVKNNFQDNKYIEEIIFDLTMPGDLSEQEHNFYRYPLRFPNERWGNFWFPYQLLVGEAVYPNNTLIGLSEDIQSIDELPEGTALPQPENVWLLTQIGRNELFNTPIPKLFMTASPGILFPTDGETTQLFF